MKSKGIRILDNKNKVVSVELSDILESISDGHLLQWSILYLNASGNLGEGNSMPLFMQQINKSEKGLPINWTDLNSLSHKLYEVIDILIISCKNENLLHRYESDLEMYETCYIIIEMVDSGYWEIFSQNQDLINRLATKFKQIEFLTPDFEK